MDPFVGQIMQVGFNFAPSGWFTCQGQLLPISQYTTLFALLGTTFGGDGQTTFQLPDFQGRTAVGVGQLSGGSTYDWGQQGGAEQITLTVQNLPAHTHIAQFQSSGSTVTLNASTTSASAAGAAGSFLAASSDPSLASTPQIYVPSTDTGTKVALGGLSLTFGSGAVTNQVTGGSAPFSPLPPYLAVTTIIAYNGIFPSRP